MKRTWKTCALAAILVLSPTAPPASHGAGPVLPSEQHPSLLFTAAQIPLLKDRIEREPYSTWWQTVRARAESTPASFDDERSRARYAKSLAFAYVMTDEETFARRAVELLEEMKFPPRGGDLGEPHAEGEVVALYAAAYDMMHPYLEGDPTTLAEIRTILAEEAARLRKGIVVREIDLGFSTLKIRLHETGHLDNWHLRAYGGLGLAALALSEHPGHDGKTPQSWSDWALDLVEQTLALQIDETDGGYAEGPFYSRYAADVYLPYMFALERLTGVDLLADPRVQKMHDWSVNLRLPSGRRPNIDDGHLDDFYGHYLAAVDEDGGAHRWDWENNSSGLYVRQYSEMDAIALYDDSVMPEEPARGPTIFMPEAGDAVFRSDWSADGTYMLLRGEHGLTRDKGLGHEHPDETSFIIYAGGEMLALDAGYINYTNHNKVNRGRNHNLILVDGQGPPLEYYDGEVIGGGNDAYIEQTFSSGFMDYAEVRAAYEGVDIRRRVMFPEREYFVVADAVSDDQSHLYEWRLHGHGGGTSEGSYDRDGSRARWTRDTAELLAFLPADAGLTFSERDTLHSFDYLEEPTHTVLRVQQSGDEVEFLAVLYPRPLDQPEPDFITLAAQGGQAAELTLGERRDAAWVLEAGAASTQFDGPAGALSSDAAFGLVRSRAQQISAYSIQDGRYLTVDGAAVFEASEAADLSLEISLTGIAGYARGPDAGYQLSLPVAYPVESLRFAGSQPDTASVGGLLRLELAGAGELSLTLAVPLAQRADFDGDGRVAFADFFMFADRYGQEAVGDVARYDLDGNGVTDLPDFFLFADVFGQIVDAA